MEIGRFGREEIVGEIHLAVAHGCVVELEIGGIGETERERSENGGAEADCGGGMRMRGWKCDGERRVGFANCRV